jgi:hypothetical protein
MLGQVAVLPTAKRKLPVLTSEGDPAFLIDALATAHPTSRYGLMAFNNDAVGRQERSYGKRRAVRR